MSHHVVEFDEECPSCQATGLYKGMVESGGIIVQCSTCKGTRKMTVTVCTGYEGTGRCYWCGGMFKNKRQRSFCCTEHQKEYYRHFDWYTAASWCKKRANYKCQDCGIDAGNIPLVGEYGKYGGTSGYRVHHIVPVDGGSRYFNPLNIPCNLLALCNTCHLKWHAAKSKINENQMQLVLNK